MNINTENIKLIVCDIDNTLIPSGRLSLSEHNRRALQKAIANGMKVMINSGRHYTFLHGSLTHQKLIELQKAVQQLLFLMKKSQIKCICLS
ncbi:MAG: HAD hydrolase family protein [Erysipelotrichaceae bacterium]|nr:HAD hydrolase family protein [Erysipelotrichaceae bacterium]